MIPYSRLLNSSLDLTGRTIELDAEAGFDPDLSYKLVSAPDITGFTAETIEYSTTMIDYDLAVGVVEQNGQDVLLADKAFAHLSENAKTLGEAYLGSIALVNMGAEFIADEGLSAIASAAEPGKVQAFGAVNGGSSRYKTGSHVDVDGVTLAAGIASTFGHLTAAAFVEAGWASSESHVSSASADGDHDYYGVGAAAIWQLAPAWRLDGSLRIGRASTEFDGRYILEAASYDADGLYATAHISTGWTMPIAADLKLDVYGRYVFTHLEGDDVTLTDSAGSAFNMDDADTHALRAGLRVIGTPSERIAWRVGAAYEHVFNGDAEGSVQGLALDAPSLEGNALIGELGLDVRASAASPWSVHFALKGYALDREGVTGSASVVYA